MARVSAASQCWDRTTPTRLKLPLVPTSLRRWLGSGWPRCRGRCFFEGHKGGKTSTCLLAAMWTRLIWRRALWLLALWRTSLLRFQNSQGAWTPQEGSFYEINHNWKKKNTVHTLDLGAGLWKLSLIPVCYKTKVIFSLFFTLSHWLHISLSQSQSLQLFLAPVSGPTWPGSTLPPIKELVAW